MALLCLTTRANGQTLWPATPFAPAASIQSTANLTPVSAVGAAPASSSAVEGLPTVMLASNPPAAYPAGTAGWLTPVASSALTVPDQPAGSRFGFGNLVPPACDDCATRSLAILVGYDSFRGLSDESWQNNGIHTGANFGTRLGAFSDWTGIGLQVGGTIGAYNWSGTDYRPDPNAQTQAFITYGLFRRANEHCGWSAGLVQDWMINNNFGVYSQNPTMSQVRGQVAYAISARNEFGLWGTCRMLDANSNVPGVGQTTWRAINQLSFFWHYKWAPGGADTWIYVGKPENDRLSGGGSLGDYVVAAVANVPLGDRVGLYSQVQYMHPSASPGRVGGDEDEWNFTIGLAYYFGQGGRSSTVAGQCWMPLMPVANNGYFLVDTNH